MASQSKSTTQNGGTAPAASAAMPPAMAEIRERSADDILQEMNRMPLFMTTLDETDGEGGQNDALEALKALAYEGTRAEIAENFRQQGNEAAREKGWEDAKQYYDKAIAALKGPARPQDPEEGPADVDVVELDPEVEAKKEKEIEEACYVNRALCNLEKQNYRSCIHDCASTLRLNPKNIKALYRSAQACLALDKLPEASDACSFGLSIDPKNRSLQLISEKITERQTYLDTLARERRERDERKAVEAGALKLALKSRNIQVRHSEQAPDLDDAAIRLSNLIDPTSTLSFPVILLYPIHAQSDFIKVFEEKDTLTSHLEYIFPLPWDTEQEYIVDGVESYMETISGGLIKVGKKMTLAKVLGSGKVEVIDGLVKVNVVPKNKAEAWIEEFKRRRRPA